MQICIDCKTETELNLEGRCVNCDAFYQDYCNQAYEENLEKDEYVVITKDMAIDAGDRSMEGHLWKWN
jgi:hypothetical protein